MNKVSLQELLASAKPKLVAEDITWNGNTATVYFQRLTMEESADTGLPFLNDDGSGVARDKIKNFQAALLAKSLRDEAGNPIATEEDVRGWDSGFYHAVRIAGEKHNPAGSAALENVAKNSETTHSDAS